MTFPKFDIIDVIVAFVLGFLCGSILFCFLRVRHHPTPPIEPDSAVSESGFESNRILADDSSSVMGVGSRCPAPATFTVTAYCPCEICCNEWSDGITASGHIIEPNDCFVAAPPDIPFGTLFSIEGYAGGQMVVVEDRGGAIQDNRLDVFFGNHDKALKWGIREFEVKQ